MHTLTVSTKGQITVPKPLREALKLYPGCKVQAVIDAKGRLVLTPALLEPEALFTGRPTVDRALSVEEMDDAIRRATRDRA
jgi:AbrB family looped-hinge helix DNA binding protein